MFNYSLFFLKFFIQLIFKKLILKLFYQKKTSRLKIYFAYLKSFVILRNI